MLSFTDPMFDHDVLMRTTSSSHLPPKKKQNFGDMERHTIPRVFSVKYGEPFVDTEADKASEAYGRLPQEALPSSKHTHLDPVFKEHSNRCH